MEMKARIVSTSDEVETIEPHQPEPGLEPGGDTKSETSPSLSPPKRALSKHSASKVARDIHWSHVSFKVAEKKILDNCWGHVPAGSVCAIMGPSGAGKSSLLNVIAGRSASSGKTTVEGHIRFGDRVINPVNFRKNIAYVMQDDALMATATPREALRFSASLRLPSSLSSAEIDELVDVTLERLHLQDCADVMVGGALIKGISGGQRKRTSVGVEIITDPALLLLDEPTSGLDSHNAFSLVELLREIASTGSAVMCTIHQPSSEVFFLFDQVIFIQHGRIMFQGAVGSLTDYTELKGHPCPSFYNPSDHIMNLAQVLEGDKLEAMFMEIPAIYQDEQEDSTRHEMDSISFHTESGFFKQLGYLTWREITNTRRDVASLIGRFGISAFLALLFGLIFYDAGGEGNDKFEDFNTHVGALSMVMISAMFGSANPVMLQFPFERPMFLREYSTGTYGALPYFLCKFSTEAPVTFMQMLTLFLITYFLMDLQGNFIFLVLGAYGLALVSNSLAIILGCAIKEVRNVSELAPLIFVPQILFAGFFIRSEQIPVYLRWAQYLCGLKYGMYIVLLTEFDLRLDSCSDEPARSNCRSIKDSNDIEGDQWYVPAFALAGLFLIFRSMAAIILTQKAKSFY